MESPIEGLNQPKTSSSFFDSYNQALIAGLQGYQLMQSMASSLDFQPKSSKGLFWGTVLYELWRTNRESEILTQLSLFNDKERKNVYISVFSFVAILSTRPAEFSELNRGFLVDFVKVFIDKLTKVTAEPRESESEQKLQKLSKVNYFAFIQSLLEFDSLHAGIIKELFSYSIIIEEINQLIKQNKGE
jgi:hypothetical protein